MKMHSLTKAVLMAVMLWGTRNQGAAQVLNNGAGQYRLTPASPTPSTFAIGSTFTSGFALDVHGELLTPPLGNVFKTDAPYGQDTYWRMFHDGIEYGNFFHVAGKDAFNLNATRGHLRLFTNTVVRAQVNSVLLPAINGFSGFNTTGFFGISGRPEFFYKYVGPFTRLHLVDETGALDPDVYAPQWGYRTWQRNGVTFTGNGGHGYLGQKYGNQARSDMVLLCTEHDGDDVSRIRFLFNSAYTGTANGVGSDEGLEGMRLFPTDNDAVHVGIGDFYADGTDPTERLHILNGRVRIQKLPDDPEAAQPYKVMVVDDSPVPSAERGVLKWVDASSLAGCGSGWSLQGNNAVTAFDGNPCPPQSIDKVGIGIAGPVAKLDVLMDASAGAFDTGIRTTVSTATAYKVGVDTYITTGGNTTWGYRAKVQGATNNFGLEVASTYGTGNGQVVGGRFTAIGSGVTSDNNIRAVWGSSGGGIGGSGGWAGWFDGKTYCTLGVWSASDSQFKQNIQDLSGATETLLQLSPKSYEFDTANYDHMGFDPGMHWGLLADDVESVVPNAVREVARLEEVDSAGDVIYPEVDFKALNYQELIPLLIAGFKEQQAAIVQLQAQIDQCCASQGSGMVAPQGDGNTESTGQESDVQEQRLVVQPNPFTDHTTLYYYVPKGGKVSLQVSGSDGRTLGTLREEQADAGQYSYTWNTTQLVPGAYFCALLVDGNVVVKRAVMVAR